MSRLKTVERDTLPFEQRRFHDAVKAIRRRPISGPFIVLMNSSPDLAARFAHLGHYFHARAAGVADTLIAAIEIDQRPSALGAHEKALFDFCQQLLRGNHHVDDATYQAAVDQFGVPNTVQIAATVGYIMMMSVIVNALDIVPVDDDSKPAL